MRIAFVCGFAWEPKGTVRLRTFAMAAELVRLGHQATIFTVPYDNRADSGHRWTIDGVEVRNSKVSRSCLSYPAALLNMMKDVWDFAPDVVHIVKPKGFSGAAAALLMATTQFPIVTDCDDWEGWGGWNEVKPYPWLLKQFIHSMECGLMRYSAALTVASRVLFQRSVALRGSDANLVYLPNCLSASQIEKIDQFRNLDQDALKTELGYPGDKAILYAGHYEAGDDISFFARAAAEVSEQTGSVVIFVGEGPELGHVRDIFASQPKAKVVFLGQLTYDRYLKALSSCDVAAFPYPDTAAYRAKCSVRIIEYMAMGKPVLTTCVGQNIEYIEDGVSGSVAVPGDHADFAARLTHLLLYPEEGSLLGQNARDRVLEKFAWEISSGRLCEQVYMQVVRQRRGGVGLEPRNR
jgi:glycosyltransferase involved in cell wall biosynthesis